MSFELDYAEFLDEALIECWELKESFEKAEKEWWILKPGMSDQGQGVRLFNSEEELREIFAEWEEAEEDEGIEAPTDIDGEDLVGARTMTSQLRHFIAQEYVNRPLLFEKHGRKKFHIRSYVLAVGALKVYVYQDMLALFAPRPYTAPTNDTMSQIDPKVHLTNTCLQSGTPIQGSVHRFWDLPSINDDPPRLQTNILLADWKNIAFDQIKAAIATLFEAAAREQMIHFQTLPNAFEAFGIDWMIDEVGTAWLLEVNAFPDFKQSGEDLKTLVGGFWDSAMQTAVGGFFGIAERQDNPAARSGMVKVLDIDLGRG